MRKTLLIFTLLALTMALPLNAAFADNGTYTVQPGDSVYKIARLLGVSPLAIIDANDLANPNLIFPGQQLIIPGASGAPGAADTWSGFTVEAGTPLYAADG